MHDREGGLVDSSGTGAGCMDLGHYTNLLICEMIDITCSALQRFEWCFPNLDFSYAVRLSPK